MEEAVTKFVTQQVSVALVMVGDQYAAFGILFDRLAFTSKINRSDVGLFVDMCQTIGTPVRFAYVDRKDIPIIESSVAIRYPLLGWRLGPNA